ncbi:hypothetical protein [Actinocrinis sp.]|uniref:hypothetical protein n=1 Tax=Actinocrinis sp. TaxID=1920516 RepID=UPI002D250E86|nr:hypothetical protein [Actinocrinis sp.]HZP51649.1 hypothetical protein [Actinocrinis sp.]
MGWERSTHGDGKSQETDVYPPDAALIGLVRAGDLEAFDSLYRRHAAVALRRAYYLSRT